MIRKLLGVVHHRKEGLNQERKDRSSRKQGIQWLKEAKEIPRLAVRKNSRRQLCSHPSMEPECDVRGLRGASNSNGTSDTFDLVESPAERL